MGLIIEYEKGQTPLSDDEMEGLLIPSVTTRKELDEVEQENIQQAMKWMFGRRRGLTAEYILSREFICDLHKRMLENVWDWAGEFRQTDKNIGVDKFTISVQLQTLIDDCKYWISDATMPRDEVAVRFKHRIVSIHCFPNGNGRHSRLMGDIIAEKILNQPIFTWGSKSLIQKGDFRDQYLTALRAADKNDYEPLIVFARS